MHVLWQCKQGRVEIDKKERERIDKQRGRASGVWNRGTN